MYVESCDQLSWEKVVDSRDGLRTLIDKLKSNLLYRKEVVRRREREHQRSDVLTSSTPECEDTEAADLYKCEVCPYEADSGAELQTHYARTHLAVKLREKFAHLARGSECKLCKQVLSDETEALVHIATSHDKINMILKENDLSTISVNQQSEKEDAGKEENCMERENQDEGNLEALELKIKQVQGQMSSSVRANLEVYALADMKDMEDGKVMTTEDVSVSAPGQNTQKMKKKKGRRRGRASEKSESKSNLRRSHRKASMVKVGEEVKERRESRMSCQQCGQFCVEEDSNLVFPCPQCDHGWHQHCCLPVLQARPDLTWQCPLCCHLDLVTSLDQLLAEVDILRETLEQKRLAELQVDLKFSKLIIFYSIIGKPIFDGARGGG